LDVSGPNTSTAVINMSTWPRMNTASNIMICRGIAGLVATSINWSNVQQNTIRTDLMTVVLSNATRGCSFKVNRSGIWSFIWTSPTSNGWRTWLDVSTNDISSVTAGATGSPLIAVGSTSVGQWPLTSWTGYLPSNTNYFYKIRNENALATTGNAYYLMIMFHYETSAAGGNFPFP
jgi:hypothetical protein